MPRGKHFPRRRKQSDERWHKHIGPHGKSRVHVLCLKCKKGIASNAQRVHIRACFGFERCRICRMPFPCVSKICPWHFGDLPLIPKELVPFFVREKWQWKNPTKEQLALERKAHAWWVKIRRRPWSDR